MAGALEGRSAVVTGASRGIGAGIARALVKDGAHVAMVARTKADLDRLGAELGAKSFAVECDIAKQGDIDRVTGLVETTFGGAPDILVNNAGIFQMTPVDQMDSGAFELMVDTNLVAPFQFVRAFLPGMRARRSGDIVSIGSVADRKIFDGNAAYSATKFGLRAMHEVLREELRGTGVRSSLVSPSSVDTPLWDGRDEAGSSGNRLTMLTTDAVVGAVMFALRQPSDVNIYELRLAHS